MEKCIVDVVEDVLGEYLSGQIMRLGEKEPKFAESGCRMKKIMGDCDAVGRIFDSEEPIAVSEEECRALIEYMRSRNVKDSKEIEIAYILGYRDCLALLRKYGSLGCLCREVQG